MINGIYELAGTHPLSQDEVAGVLSEILNRPVVAQQLDQQTWYEDAVRKNMPNYTRDTLLSMFKYYDQFGLAGSPRHLNLSFRQKNQLQLTNSYWTSFNIKFHRSSCGPQEVAAL